MHSRSAHRPGFTLVELIIALSLALIVSGATLAVLHQQQQLNRDLANALRARMRVREATAILAASLRGASANDSIYLAADTAVELFTTIGASVVCTAPTSTRVALPPDSSTGPVTTSLLAIPDSSDAVSLFRDSSTLSSTRGWSRYPIASTTRPPAATTCPPTSTFTTAADIAANRHNYELLLATPLPFPPVPGSPVRLIRRARYSLYRASDGLWYLGYRRCTGAGCATVQPVSGPYAGATPPLTFKYYDGSGRTITPLVPTTAIARIDVVAHAATPTQVKLPGLPLAVFTDSSVTSIALRNAP